MRALLFIILVLFVVSGFSQNSPGFPVSNSNWVVTDALGRRLPDYKQTGPVKNEKWVGLFYYIWHGGHAPTDTIYDITKILKKDPVNPEYGPKGQFHYWGEPEAMDQIIVPEYRYHKIDRMGGIRLAGKFQSNR